MKIDRHPIGDGLSFSLEPADFKLCDWRGFLYAVSQTGAQYNGEHTWTVPESGVLSFFELKGEYFDSVIDKNQLKLF